MALTEAERQKRWRQKHPEAVRVQKQRYYERHSERLKAKRNPINLARKRNLRKDILASMGNKCVSCGFTDWRVLQIDHVNGNGREDRTQFKSYEQFYKAIVTSPHRYQLLCSNCNWIKRYEEKEHN